MLWFEARQAKEISDQQGFYETKFRDRISCKYELQVKPQNIQRRLTYCTNVLEYSNSLEGTLLTTVIIAFIYILRKWSEFLWSFRNILFAKLSLILKAKTSQNGQIYFKNRAAFPVRSWECVWPFCDVLA